MNLLLDTHAFLWFVRNGPKLSATARNAIAAPQRKLFLSPASYWELAIKVQLGKYQLNMSFQEFIEKGISLYDLTVLPIEPVHAAEVSGLTRHHGDPFDRLIIAQAIVEQLTIVSADEEFDAYPIPRLW